MTPDLAEAIQKLEKSAAVARWKLVLSGPKSGTDEGNLLSLAPAGREVHLSLARNDVKDPQVALNALWGFAVPLGFTPWLLENDWRPAHGRRPGAFSLVLYVCCGPS